jgi:hypothetical protein
MTTPAEWFEAARPRVRQHIIQLLPDLDPAIVDRGLACITAPTYDADVGRVFESQLFPYQVIEKRRTDTEVFLHMPVLIKERGVIGQAWSQATTELAVEAGTRFNLLFVIAIIQTITTGDADEPRMALTSHQRQRIATELRSRHLDDAAIQSIVGRIQQFKYNTDKGIIVKDDGLLLPIQAMEPSESGIMQSTMMWFFDGNHRGVSFTGTHIKPGVLLNVSMYNRSFLDMLVNDGANAQ